MAKDEQDEQDELPDDGEPMMEGAGGGAAARGGITFLVGFVVGALVGAGAALLLAPQSGAVTRRRLGRGFRRMRRGAADRMGNLRDDAERELRRARRRLRRHLPD
jgi:uncharacterized membrane protein YccC